jgi:AmmeMemoRadiSam system protein B
MEEKPWIRQPAVAGRFYPGDARELEREVSAHLASGAGGTDPVAVRAIMVPHAGTMYSGGVAGQVFARVEVPPRAVVMGPNHTGRGARISVVPAGAFVVPGGRVEIDEELAAAILEEVPGAQADLEAHRFEHSIEVELPFLRARRADVRFVPIVLGGISGKAAAAVGEGLARAIARVGGDTLVVASSDMSHYLPDAEARVVDRTALEPLLAFDPGQLYRTVVDQDISMCGFIPATAMLAYARAAGATSSPELVAYATSGDAAGGDRSRVVGYAGVLVR